MMFMTRWVELIFMRGRLYQCKLVGIFCSHWKCVYNSRMGIFLFETFTRASMQHTIVTNWLQSRRLSKVPVEFTACDLANFASKTIFFFGCRAELQCSMELKRTFGFSTRCRAERVFCQLWVPLSLKLLLDWESIVQTTRCGLHSQDFSTNGKRINC